ncbi:hypothetical protein D3C86_1879950 [compost metagenome]
MRLKQATDDQGVAALLLQYLPWSGATTEPDWAQATTHVLLSGVSELQIMYQDARPEPAVWASRWSSPDQVPQRIRLVLHTSRGQLPDFIIAMRPLAASDPRARGAVFGGDIR